MKFAFFVVILSFCSLKPFIVSSQVNTGDSLALVDLYNSTGGPGWTKSDNWLTGSPVSTWSGVTVSNGRVTVLRMAANNLNGTLPSSLGSLNALDTILMSDNHLTGGIPASLGLLSELRFLDMVNDNLTGEIPTELGDLINLTTCHLAFNHLSGPIPSSLGNLSKLRQLNLEENNLSGSIPSSLGNIPDLYDLYLWNNSLSGSLPPELGHLSHLSHLMLSGNNLSGTIPASFAGMSALTFFSVSNNNMEGDLSALANLGGLALLGVDHNHFSGPVPSFAGNLLTQVSIANNRFSFDGMENFAGRFPSAVYSPQADLQITANGSLLSVSAGGILAANTYTWYRNGSMIGQKTGDPTFTKTLPGVYEVKITNAVANKLSLYGIDTVGGHVRDSLALVDLYNSTGGLAWRNHTNWLTTAPLNSWFGVTVDDNSNRVTRLALPANTLTGPIPASIGNLLDATFMDISINQLTDTLPATFANLIKLDTCKLYANYLKGKIPVTVAPIAFLDLGYNQFDFTTFEDVLPRYPLVKYDPQFNFDFNSTANLLSVSAGGTLSNNTYKWYKNNTLFATKNGDSTLTIVGPGSYRVEITNAIATGTTLASYTKVIYYNTRLADTTTTVNRFIGGTLPVDVSDSVYERILTITPAGGANGLLGMVSSTVTIDTVINLYMNQPYVQRHFDVTPADNAANAQASLTLYFTQQDFDNFNQYVITNNLGIPLLPQGGIDNGNVRIIQLHGSFTGSSNPANYGGSLSVITPVTVWDAVNGWWTVSFPVNGFSGFFVSTVNLALPLQLLQFTGAWQNDAVHLHWLTTAEVNTRQFVVQRSQDGVSFKSIGVVAAQSTTGNHSYVFTDQNATGNKSFYRLKMQDIDGRFTYSKLIAVNAGNLMSGFTVYPNPVATSARIVFSTVASIHYEITVTDIDGKILQRFTGISVPGVNTFSLNVSPWASGNYLISLSDKENGLRSLQFTRH